MRRLASGLLGTALLLSLLGSAPSQAGPALAQGEVDGSALIADNGPAGHRITLVLIGDGYTREDLPRFRQQALAAWQAVSSVEPFHRYQRFFDVRRVDLVSPHSGVDDGSPTPLGLHFDCEGTERLLCADDDAVQRYVGTDGDQPQYVIALADSTDYGGCGGDGVTTLSGGSPDAGRIIQHELGHTIGKLGDEYDSAPGVAAAYPNLSDEPADVLRRKHLRWWRWLGAPDPTGGRVGAYRSANGLYRPTQDSIMRTLGLTYNLPSREAIVEQLYRFVSPLDQAVPAPGQVGPGTRLRAAPQQLVGGGQLTVRWLVDGKAAPDGAVHGDTLDTAALPRSSQPRTITAVVRDGTPWVRDEAFRNARMTATVRWLLRA